MSKNVELKAHVKNMNDLLEKAQSLCNGREGTLIVQHDTFFNTNYGRLKLRVFGHSDENNPAELIYYNRQNDLGPKVSDYVKVDLIEPSQINNLKVALSSCLGVRGNVSKKRILFLPAPDLRIHVDEVDKLGNFMEIEVCIDDKITTDEGETIARNTLAKLGIPEADLISGAYIDKLVNEIQ